MLVDKVRVDFGAGAGGSGAVSFAINKKPSGGDGGKGGDVYLLGENNLYDLRNFKQTKKYSADNGEPGSSNNRKGSGAKDLIIKVPLVTKVYDLDQNLLATVKEHGEKVLLLTGGIGGRGNYYFRKGQLDTLKKHTPGKPGEELKSFLELELMSDIVFIGLPNAGKSSMLNTLTNSNVKVADYPFTTLFPYLGIAEGMRLMDLPGLIEGTAKGKGIGKNYGRHLKNAKAIAHFLSLEESDPQASYKLIRKEVEEIAPELASRPEILVLTKSDNFSSDEIDSKLKDIKKWHNNYVVVSVIDDNQLSKLIDSFKKSIK